MEVFKIYQINTDYKDAKGPPNWEMWLSAEIVFVDKTHGRASLVYQLKDCYLPIEKTLEFCKMHPTEFAKDGFLLLGQEVSFDKKKKQILLDSRNTVSYNHLVVVSGKRPLLSLENEELIAALQALNDALKVKPKIPSSFASTIKTTVASKGQSAPLRKQYHNPHLQAHAPSKEIDQIVQPNFTTPPVISVELNAMNKRLYEVQL